MEKTFDVNVTPGAPGSVYVTPDLTDDTNTCFYRQVNADENKKFYTQATKQSLQNNISAVKELLLKSHDELVSRTVAVRARISQLENEINNATDYDSTIKLFYDLIGPVIPVCADTSLMADKVRQLSDIETTARVELEYRLSLANLTLIETENEISDVDRTLLDLDRMNSALLQ